MSIHVYLHFSVLGFFLFTFNCMYSKPCWARGYSIYCCIFIFVLYVIHQSEYDAQML